ncbi:PQQ-dependent sugar dehydrogenase [Flavobacterium aquidurense]|uniref:PQQ-dependent sugar dehydrogenase n=1 Tax=Flavobacterium aquidurense TaxID=362413 RepID=UPI00286BA2D9|nr:PQQ-dependent sugar dehydrogenase [Flavobacterium aquidurense]
MRHSNFIISILSSVLFIACGCSNDKDHVETPDPGTSTDPVETNTPNTAYKPAFAGQTRASGLKTNTAFEAKVITSGLTAPWGVKSLPDGRLLVTQKAGNMRIVTVSGEVSAPITGIPAVNPAGQGGLLGLCLDPEFASNRMIYWVFSEAVTGGNQTSVAKGRLSNDEKAIEGAVVIYRANPANPSDLHYGGRILFDSSGNLVVSTGERSVLQTRPLAQSVTAGLGKVIRITKTGQPAPGNPTFTTSGALPELYTIGHRNPQGLALNSVTGEIWLAEHGPRGGDEINRLKAGSNYGWPTITYGIEYSGEKVGAGIQQQEGLEQPVYYWDPVVSPSGMTFYKGNRVPEWQNNLFIGALSGMHIVRLAIENNKVVGEERLLAGEGQRFRDITQGNDGALYAVTDQGRLYKIDKK